MPKLKMYSCRGTGKPDLTDVSGCVVRLQIIANILKFLHLKFQLHQLHTQLSNKQETLL